MLQIFIGRVHDRVDFINSNITLHKLQDLTG
jgi:hypothetical protein